jgi:hypothetical protein
MTGCLLSLRFVRLQSFILLSSLSVLVFNLQRCSCLESHSNNLWLLSLAYLTYSANEIRLLFHQYISCKAIHPMFSQVTLATCFFRAIRLRTLSYTVEYILCVVMERSSVSLQDVREMLLLFSAKLVLSASCSDR